MYNNEEQALEVSALRSIYCKDGEMTDSRGQNYWRISLHLDVTPGPENNDVCCEPVISHASVQFTLPEDYPELSPPAVEVKCSDLDKNAVDTITKTLSERARELQGEMMLLDLACLAKELIEKELRESAHMQRLRCAGDMAKGESIAVKSDSNNENPFHALASDYNGSETSQNKPSGQVLGSNCANTVTSLLHLDHMRSKSSYTKLIKKWAYELSLVGRLIFCQRLILILLQGDSKDVKEYIVRNRTSNVDVDSRGRSCKERMLSVLCEVPTRLEQQLEDFAVVECLPEELTDFFKSRHLEEIYSNHVRPLMPGKGATRP
ncbi:RWD domain-containing protein 3 [Elysia marginata]|uniref:RWD domain-containing protein 3 n=1 Tax=Elysia marginata TaxID=1093978 RepID=A0AAV4IG13_9GAST|nr:RWD domain-containing protein 3 [Elysia marginata]